MLMELNKHVVGVVAGLARIIKKISKILSQKFDMPN